MFARWIAALALLAAASTAMADDVQPHRIVVAVASGLLNFDVLIVNNDAPIRGVGGGMAVTERGVMIAHALDGTVAFYDSVADRMTTLRFRLPPTNIAALPLLTPGGRRVDRSNVRYQNIATFEMADGLHLLVSHDYYDPDEACFTTRFDEALLPPDWSAPLLAGETPGSSGGAPCSKAGRACRSAKSAVRSAATRPAGRSLPPVMAAFTSRPGTSNSMASG